MSWAFITALKKNPQQSYVQLLNSIRDELEAKYTQKPQLSCSHPLGTSSLFVLSFCAMCTLHQVPTLMDCDQIQISYMSCKCLISSIPTKGAVFGAPSARVIMVDAGLEVLGKEKVKDVITDFPVWRVRTRKKRLCLELFEKVCNPSVASRSNA